MRLYPDIPSRRVAALSRDLLVLLLVLLFAWLGLAVHDVVDKLAVLGEGVRRTGEEIPLVGGPIEDLGEDGENAVHRLATVLGLIVFGLPTAILLVRYLSGRIEQFRRLNEAARVLADPTARDRRRLVAMRAAFGLPYGALLRHTQDPLGDLAAERYEPLIAAALDDAGLRLRTTS